MNPYYFFFPIRKKNRSYQTPVRLLWSTREAPSILAIPRDLKYIHKDGKARGHYKKGIEKEH